MPAITYDGRSFSIEGRRIWIVSGSIHYARTPRSLWRDLIAAARHAGLNTIETPIFWALHEPRPGVFDFEGDHDIRAFVEMIAEAGMHCILRPGPYIGSAWDFGGLPTWLLDQPEMAYRTNARGFMEASARYISALAAQVRDLQVNTPGGGPILLIQNESHWTCGLDSLAGSYLGEIGRFLREAGFTVPTINANNLWQSAEGEIDAWSGSEHMLATMRQLAAVHPEQPRLVIDFSVTHPSVFTEPDPGEPAPMAVQRRLVEILAGGGQFNIDPFHGGTNLGFSGGRLPGGPSRFVTNTNDRHAPLTEAGAPGASYNAVRRVCQFASSFARVLAHLEIEDPPAVLDPASAGGGRQGAGLSIVHRRGSQGEVVFVLGGDPARTGQSSPRRGAILTEQGAAMPFDLGQQAAGWYLRNVNLDSRVTLDYTNLNALTHRGRLLVLFGPAGMGGELSLNDSPVTVPVPKGKSPTIFEHEGMVVVIANEDSIDAVAASDAGLYLDAGMIGADGTPIPSGTASSVHELTQTGETVRVAASPPARSPGTPTLGPWTVADLHERLDGTSPRYASIEGPAEMSALGAAKGYGWYRVRIRSGTSRRVRVAAPHSGDRLLAFIDGEPAGVLGVGPGASGDLSIPLRKGVREVVFLADNMGRYSAGSSLGDRKGLFGDLWEVAPLKVGRASAVESAPLEPLEFRAPLWSLRAGDATHPERVTWSFLHRRKTPLIIVIENLPARGLVVVNDEPMEFLERGWTGQIMLDTERLSRGKNTVQFAAMEDDAGDGFGAILKAIASSIRFLEGVSCVTDKAEWAFAKWETPPPEAFEPITKSSMGDLASPAWWRSSFELSHPEVPLYIETSGLTKGQLYVNGHHLGRYWRSEPGATRTAVPPQSRHYVPRCWVNRDGPNDLLIFDEHGGNPSRVKLVHDPHGGSTLG